MKLTQSNFVEGLYLIEVLYNIYGDYVTQGEQLVYMRRFPIPEVIEVYHNSRFYKYIEGNRQEDFYGKKVSTMEDAVSWKYFHLIQIPDTEKSYKVLRRIE